MRRGHAMVAAALALVALPSVSCKTRARERGEELSAASAAASTDPGLVARRPTRRYYLARTNERCEVYSIDGDTISPPEPAPCPGELQIGERIRIAGKTCVQESADKAVPVVCPDPLTNAERRDREGR